MLDGAARIGQLMDRVVELGMSAIAITDHGNLHGAYEFWKQAKARDIKPIIGLEAYVAPESRTSRNRVLWGGGGEDDVSGAGAYTHMTIWSTDTASMHNLFRISSESYLTGFFSKPRIDRELLQQFGKGLIGTTGCPSGEVATKLRLGQYAEAKKAAGELAEIFGAGNYFVELMDHGLELETRVRSELLSLAKELNLPLVATNDLHYTNQEHSRMHEALLCLQTNSSFTDPNRWRFNSSDYYLKSAAEMRELFRDFPEAADNTLLIAERSDVTFAKRDLMPKFPLPEGKSEQEWFEEQVWRGMATRFPGGYSEKHREQAEYEIRVITEMGFPGYFLVVADFIEWARNQGIRVGPGRGSAAGSLVAYALGITALDPIAQGLIFERFLNPERSSLPDIDVDFDDRRRSEVIRYVTEKYGADRVAQISTFNTIKAKQAIKDAARVLDFPYHVGEKLSKAVPPMVLGRDVSLGEIFDPEAARYAEAADFRELVESDSESAAVVELARELESLKRQTSVHAAGVIMSAEPLADVLPLMRREGEASIITQFDQPPCEDLGLLKMDFLGLRNLTVLDDAIANIRSNRGEEVVLENLDLNSDAKTFELMSQGDTLGVFQLDGNSMRALLRMIRPSEFEHISAAISLIRPGPVGMKSHINYAQRKNGQQRANPMHPELDEPLREILDFTYGLIVYQEQVMAAAQKVAGFTLGQADLLRRAMGKKKPEELAKAYEEFHSGAVANGYSEAAIKVLWDTLLPFADYAFNRSHSAGYAVLSYWTGYLKANYPAEYMAALLTSVGDDRDRLASYLAECRRLGIKVLPPDVNQSQATFAAVGDDIRFGLLAIRNVGRNVVDSIISVRESSPYLGFIDFLQRSDSQVASPRIVESLIKAGALDSLGEKRRVMYAMHEEAITLAQRKRKELELGQLDLFGELMGEPEAIQVNVPNLPEWQQKDLLAYEREMLGLYVSSHPLSGLESQLSRHSDTSALSILELNVEDGATVNIAGLITQVQHKVARNSGNQYALMVVEDNTGEVEVTVMRKVYQALRETLYPDQIITLRGRISKRDDRVSVQAIELNTLEVARESGGLVKIQIREQFATKDRIAELNELLVRYPGEVEVQLTLSLETPQHFMLPHRVRVVPELFGEIKSMFGADAVK